MRRKASPKENVEVIFLSDEGMDFVMDLLSNPPPPNKALKELMSGSYRIPKKKETVKK